MKLELPRGTTSKLARIFIQDSSKTDGSGLSGLAFNTSGLTWYYFRDGDTSATSISPVTASLGSWTSGGFKEISATNMPGVYELGIPNAVLSTGASVQMLLKGAANMVICPVEFELTSTSNQDATRGGMSALPNATPGATGGILIAGTNASTTFGNLTVSGAVSVSGDFDVGGNFNVGGSLTVQSGEPITPFNHATDTVLVETVLNRDVNAGGTTNSTLNLANSASPYPGAYLGCLVVSKNQVRRIVGYSGANSYTAMIAPNWQSNPATGDAYFIVAGARSDVGTILGTPVTAATSGVLDVNVKNINNVAAATPGAAGGILIAGSNAATTFATLSSTGAFTVNGTSAVSQTGDSFTRIGAAGAGLTAIGDTRIAHLNADVSTRSQPGDKMDLVDVPNATGIAAVVTANWGAASRTLTAFAFTITPTPPTAAQIAAVILSNTSNKLFTDSSGFVTFNNANVAVSGNVSLSNTTIGNIQNGLATQGNVTNAVTSIEAHGDANWGGGSGGNGTTLIIEPSTTFVTSA